MTKTIEVMKAERRRLDREIRAAKRAEIKAAKEALLSERRSLGVWLSESVGADSVESVKALKTALGSYKVQANLAAQIGTSRPDVRDSAMALESEKSPDTSGNDAQRQPSARPGQPGLYPA